MTTPLVTVITPCYDDNATLSLALASLQAQTMAEWECIVIDDGSAPGVKAIVDSFGDRRLRYTSFDHNRGRPVARQRGLEMSRGQFICMLDADDWYYPHKLEWQLDVLEEHPELMAVSSSMAVVDERGRLTGIRHFTDQPLQIRRCLPPRPPHIPFSPIMIRRHAAVAHRFDPRLRRSEDPDYLMRVLNGALYGIMGRPTYVYQEQFSRESMEEALRAFEYQRIFYRDYLRQEPLPATRQYLWSVVKTLVYRGALAAGRGRWLFERRNRAPRPDEYAEFLERRESVGEKGRRAFAKGPRGQDAKEGQGIGGASG